MNDDAAPSTSNTPHNDLSQDLQTVEVEEGPSIADDQRLRTRLQQAKRTTFLDDLVRNLDIMIYCELSVLYYMDCSLLRFLSRALPQWFYFTPKPAFFPAPPPNRPYVAAITLTNVVNILIHTFSNAPAAGEAMRGYLHGALLIDFVGELGPISKVRLVLLDILTLVLQFVIFAVVMERDRLKRGMEGSLAASPTGAEHASREDIGQDLDAEEQGVHREADDGVNGIEMRNLRSSVASNEEERAETEAEVLMPRGERKQHPLDTFNSGQHVIANLHVIDTIRTSYRQWTTGGIGGGSTTVPAALSTTTSATTARQRLGQRIREVTGSV